MSSGRGAVGLLLMPAKYFADLAAVSASNSFMAVSSVCLEHVSMIAQGRLDCRGERIPRRSIEPADLAGQ
jgi:hypothetical protein